MSLAPLFSYYGTKGEVIGQYPRPRHDMIVEPFCGAAGYALAWNTAEVHLYDLDEYVVATWDYLIGASSQDILDLPLDVQDVRKLDIPKGAQNLIGYWINPASAMPKRSPSQRPKWNADTRARVAWSVPQIKHWTVSRQSYETVPDYEATWFIDPPYQHAGKWYRHGAASIDFPKLGEWCQARSGQVIVCDNEGADWLPFRYLCGTNGMAGRSQEVIWTSHEDDVLTWNTLFPV